MSRRSLIFFVDTLSVLRKNKELAWPHALLLVFSGANSLALGSVYQAVHGRGIANAH